LDVQGTVRPQAPLRVLVLDEEPPYPCDSGKKIRTWNLLANLAKRHSITYLCYMGTHCASAEHALHNAGIQLISVPGRQREAGLWMYLRAAMNVLSSRPFSVSKHDRSSYQRALERLLGTEAFDLIHCEWTPYAQFALRQRSTQSHARVPVLIATHNIEAAILSRRGEQQKSRIGRAYFAMQADRMELFERDAFSRTDYVTTVSEGDRLCAQQWGAQRASLVENGVALEYHQRGLSRSSSGKELLFLGSLDWFPNVDAVQYFTREILPRIRERETAAHLTIVGRRPDNSLRKKIAVIPGATLVGEVEDIRSYLCRAAVVIVPLRIGGGTRIKILEAMATEKIVVSTSIGAEGLEVEHGVHLLLADTPQEFADAVLHALDPSDLVEMPLRARALVEARYGWQLQSERLERCWMEAANRVG
jgi:glycosyltransferase involved in cell wall biosynthesis